MQARVNNGVINTNRYIFTGMSMLGSVLVAMPSSLIRSCAFALWIVANILWLNDAYKRHDKEQMLLYAFFTLTAAIGFCTNIAEVL